MKIKLPNIIKKYRLYWGVLFLFLIYMLFIGEYTWVRVKRDQNKLERLQTEQTYYKNKIKADREQLRTMQTDTQALERFAREEYLLKKENEDLFVIIEEE